MVLMQDVVAVQGVVSKEVSKLEEELKLTGVVCPYGAVPEPHDVLPGSLIDGNRFAISRENLEFFKMVMDRVEPATTRGQGP